MDNDNYEIVHIYTKKQAVEDGFQYEVDEQFRKEAGYLIPVYITIGVHKLCEVPKDIKCFQDYKGRLWDVLTIGRIEFLRIYKNSGEYHLIPFKVIFQKTLYKKEKVKLWLCFNEYEGFTIMLPEEH